MTCSRDQKLIVIFADQQERRAEYTGPLCLPRNAVVHKQLSAASLEEFSLGHKGEKIFYSYLLA